MFLLEMKKSLFLLIIIFPFLGATGKDYTIDNLPNVHLKNKFNYVSNPDGILSETAVGRIDTLLFGLEQRTSAEVAVVVVRSIGNLDIKEFAIQLFESWGIGKKEKDNGLLILFVENQRKITFETGYGIEGVLPDMLCKRIQVQQMLPAFKTGDYDRGMIAGITAVIQQLSTPEAIAEIRSIETGKTDDKNPLIRGIGFYCLFALLLSIAYLFIIHNDLKRSFDQAPYSKYRSLVRHKSSLLVLGLIFPLFLFFIYLWVRWKLNRLRNGRHICETCGRRMKKLNEQEEDLYLTTSEQTEEKLNTVDYDVWLCNHCGAKKILSYENPYTGYTVCPHCQAKAYALESDRILVAPTTFSAGTGEKSYSCAACHYRHKSRYTIPIIVIPPIHRGGRGGFGGGNFGGGSFGGGRSGGGGSTSSW